MRLLVAIATVLAVAGCARLQNRVGPPPGQYQVVGDGKADVIWVTRQFTDNEGRISHGLFACYRSATFTATTAQPVCYLARTHGAPADMNWGPR